MLTGSGRGQGEGREERGPEEAQVDDELGELFDGLIDVDLEKAVVEEDDSGCQEDEDDVAELFGDFDDFESGAGEEDHEHRDRQDRQQNRAQESGERQRSSQQEPDAVPDEAANPPGPALPVAPSQAEWDDHFRLGHIVYRFWCPICVQSRGREDDHKRADKNHRRPGAPTICLDYKEIRKGRPPLIVMRDQQTKTTTAHQCSCRGPGDQWVISRLLRDIENTGHAKITLKGDGEPAMQELVKVIAEQRAQPTVPEAPPGNDHQSHGVAEKTVQDVMGQVRALKLSLEYRIGIKVDDSLPIFDWLVEHAASLITRLRLGTDGMSAWQRVTGRACEHPLVEFGELVWAKPLRASAGKQKGKADLEARWFKAVWVGAHDRTNEHVVIAADCGPAVRVRSIKRMTEQERWDSTEIHKVLARPRQPDPRKLQRNRELREQAADRAEAAAAQPSGEPGGESLPPGRIAPSDPVMRRDFRITRKLIDDNGPSPDCPGCRQAMRPGSVRGNHTNACRRRFEDILKEGEVGRRRLRERDVRHGLVQEERQEDNVEHQVERGSRRARRTGGRPRQRWRR